ncbi:MAG: pilus assembly protein TadG-related protein [Planctomycetaceae bacterium]|nr:pilus assembly protein TadG-related protein [Planctomycetaceae bacterium]
MAHRIQAPRRTNGRPKSGAGLALVWTALLIVLFLALAALACDVAWIRVVSTELQNAADAASLAGAQFVTRDVDKARTQAVRVALANYAANTPVRVDPNTSNSAAGDVVIGQYSRATRQFTATLSAPNAVKVIAHRLGSNGDALPLFFAGILGVDKTDVTAHSVAVLSDDTQAIIKFTPGALGFAATELNAGSTVTPDIAGKLITSPQTGVGSILWVQRSGKAGMGTSSDPLLMTITATSHMDTLSFPPGFPVPNDFKAAAIYIAPEGKGLPDGCDEGLGVRAFTISTVTGQRVLSGGLAKIEGSKEVSGGTGPASGIANGPPHVDEELQFAISDQVSVKAQGVKLVLSKFGDTDAIDLAIALEDGTQMAYKFIGPGHRCSSAFTNLGNSVWAVNFASLEGLPNLRVSSFAIRAIDPNPTSPKGTAEHFDVARVEIAPPASRVRLVE